MTVRESSESPLGPASLLRAAADRELTADQERLLEAHLQANPADKAGIQFERNLRSAVGRAMGHERAPAHLAERVARALHADDSKATTHDRKGVLPVSEETTHDRKGVLPVSEETRHDRKGVLPVSEETTHDRKGVLPVSEETRHDRKGVLPVSDSGVQTQPPVVETIASQTRRRSFWTTLGGRLAVAAALVLAVGGLWYASTNLGQQPITQWDDSAKLQLAGFLSEEHMRCDDPDYAADKFIARDMDEIARCCLTILDQTPQLEQIFENGATLVGLGPCQVPGPGRSVHMQVLMPIDESGAIQSTVSLFMQQSAGREGFVASGSFDLQEARSLGFVVDVWEKDGLIYYLVCDGIEAAQAARRALRVIAPNQSL